MAVYPRSMTALLVSLVLMRLTIVRCDGNHGNWKVQVAAKSVDVHRINCTAESIEHLVCIHATSVSTGKPVVKKCLHNNIVTILENDDMLTKLSETLPDVIPEHTLLFYFLIPKVPRVLQDSLAEFNCTFMYGDQNKTRPGLVSRIPMLELTCCAHSDNDDSKQCDGVATTNSSEYSGIGTCAATGEFNSIDIWPKPLLYNRTKLNGQTALASAIDPNPSESKTYKCVAESKHNMCSKELTYRPGRTPRPVSDAGTLQGEQANVTPRQKGYNYIVVGIISCLVGVGVGVGVTLGVMYFRRTRRMAGSQNHDNEPGEGAGSTLL